MSKGFGGKGNTKGGGGGKSGKGGGRMWADPVWRAARLAEMEAKRPRVAVDGAAMGRRLTDWATTSRKDDELQLTDNFGRDGVRHLQEVCRSIGLWCQSYGKGQNTVVIVAKRPLPSYRADLDTRHGTQSSFGLYMSAEDEALATSALAQHGGVTRGGGGTSGAGAAGVRDVAAAAGASSVETEAGLKLEQQPLMGPEATSWEDLSDDISSGDVDGREKISITKQLDPRVGVLPLPPPSMPSLEPLRNPSRDERLRAAEMARRAATAAAFASSSHLPISITGANAFEAARRQLPAYGAKAAILASLGKHSVIVVKGATGSGKTTQVPQFILEDADENGRGSGVSIVCTQPRRIAAVSVAERVALERQSLGDGQGPRGGTEVGGCGAEVGYSIRLESRRSPETRLLFCTTGILLRRLAGDPYLAGVTHVIVDEIHERGLNEDFLLICLKDLLVQRPKLRVILMSATIQVNKAHCSSCRQSLRHLH